MALENVQGRIRHDMLEFQIGDLRKAACDGLNFLAAIGLMVSTEFLGGLITGYLGLPGSRRVGNKSASHSELRFEAGFKFLGQSYEQLLDRNKDRVLDIYKNVRCGLVHQYLPPKVEGIYTRAPKGAPGVLEKSGALLIAVDNYIWDLEDAINRLVGNLVRDNNLLQKCEQALNNIPKLD